jgi:hypothetical protein
MQRLGAEVDPSMTTTVEHHLLALFSVNMILELIKKLVVAVEPLLSPLLIMVQIAVAVGTLIWIFRKARGAKLENEQKERDLKTKSKRKK